MIMIPEKEKEKQDDKDNNKKLELFDLEDILDEADQDDNCPDKEDDCDAVN